MILGVSGFAAERGVARKGLGCFLRVGRCNQLRSSILSSSAPNPCHPLFRKHAFPKKPPTHREGASAVAAQREALAGYRDFCNKASRLEDLRTLASLGHWGAHPNHVERDFHRWMATARKRKHLMLAPYHVPVLLKKRRKMGVQIVKIPVLIAHKLDCFRPYSENTPFAQIRW
eukprot:2888426-Alexandrium_andersonii.AAC.1